MWLYIRFATYRRWRFWQKKIIFSDEAYFEFGGCVNKQNCRIWGTEKPHAYIEKPMHPQWVTVWCGFWSRRIIGPFFFEGSKERSLQSMAIVIGPCWTNFCSQKLKRILATFGNQFWNLRNRVWNHSVNIVNFSLLTSKEKN